MDDPWSFLSSYTRLHFKIVTLAQLRPRSAAEAGLQRAPRRSRRPHDSHVCLAESLRLGGTPIRIGSLQEAAPPDTPNGRCFSSWNSSKKCVPPPDVVVRHVAQRDEAQRTEPRRR